MFLVHLILSSYVVTYTYGFNFTYSMAARCKEHISRDGYRYDTFYLVDHGAHTKKESGTALEMHIAILAPRDGHILLSHVFDPQQTDPVYEIVIGGGSNTFSELRRMRQKYAKSSKRTPNILSSIQYHAFWIKIYIDGTIEFGEEGKELPLLSYLDPDPIIVNYFSFAAWSGIEAKFLYDCPVPGDVVEVSNSTIVEEPPLPLSMQLRRTILEKSAGVVAPVGENGSRVLVTLMTKVLTLDFDVKSSTIDVIMAFIMVWQYPDIKWDPNKYGGLNGIIFQNGELWTPQLTVFNGIGFGTIKPGSKTPLAVTKDGTVVQSFSDRFKAWCDPGDGIIRWPRDEHVCTLKIGPYATKHQLILAVAELDVIKQGQSNYTASSDSNIGTDWESINEASDWSILKLTQHTEWYDDSPYQKLDVKSKSIDPEDEPETKLIVTINIKRRDYCISVLVYTPVFVLMFCSLAQFLIPYETNKFKSWGSLIQVIIACSLLCTIQGHIPFISKSIPDVAYFYICMIYTSLAYWWANVLRSHDICKRAVNSRIFLNFLSTPFVRIALCLPQLKDGDDYKSLQECSSGLSDTEELRQSTAALESEETIETQIYGDFVLVTDRIIFFVYLIFYVSLMFYHY